MCAVRIVEKRFCNKVFVLTRENGSMFRKGLKIDQNI